jgi:sugar (pentulose or hexulose) kinase
MKITEAKANELFPGFAIPSEIAQLNLEVGKRQNVRSAYTEQYGELIRTVTRIEYTKEKDGLWFHWYWQPEQCPNLAGSMDCGFSGRLIAKN